MKSRRRVLAVLALVVVTVMMLATAGLALAGWDWCSDPILAIGNDEIGYTETHVDLFIDGGAWNYDSFVEIVVPNGINVRILDAQGSTVRVKHSGGLEVRAGKHVETEIKVRVEPREGGDVDDGPRIKVVVSADGHTVATKVGGVDDNIKLKALIP